ncbi:unnamed protein product [Mytilus coruscus]|uniref:B box-type domain-containing protein n=1 Tax=Mytilus coruscus TaxID=42192 RepID=A0A6J8CG88_MYTCO|nr:unnamed protein product [Mytilus coruscus]
MASNLTVCGVCDSLEITKPSVVWCSDCDEGFCADSDKHHAVSKASRSHCTIPITESNKLPIDILEITHNCSKHNEKYQIYCRKHDCPCCRRCVIETHNDCKDITPIDDIIKDVKSSNALHDIELMLVEVAENLEKIMKDRKDNITSLKDQRRMIEKEIQQTRMKIDTHLDQIEEDLIKELNTKKGRERKKIEDLLTSLEKKKKRNQCSQDHASVFQTYLAIKQMETKMTIEERFVENFASSESFKRIVLSLKDDKAFQTISIFKSFGEIEVEIKPSEIMLTRMKGKQAQFEVVNVLPRLIENIKLNLKRTIKTGLSNTKGCLIQQDDRLALSCRDNNLVRVFNRTDIWTLKDKNVLNIPKGITVDNNGNVHVAITDSCKVIVISSDGKRYLELLSANDGLHKPTALDYDRSRSLLLVGNQTDTALHFQVAIKN